MNKLKSFFTYILITLILLLFAYIIVIAIIHFDTTFKIVFLGFLLFFCLGIEIVILYLVHYSLKKIKKEYKCIRNKTTFNEIGLGLYGFLFLVSVILSIYLPFWFFTNVYQTLF